jgi:hypothetical protein
MILIAVFTCDANHTMASTRLVAIADSLDNAIELCRQSAKKQGESLNADDVRNLQTIKQTQGFLGHGEFMLAYYDLNTLDQ